MVPDFLIIGAQKSGTTSLFDILKSSAEIYMPEHKETQFFSRTEFFDQGLDEYRGLFSGASPGQITGEASPQYLCSKTAAERIALHCKNAKLIAILRDPVQRAISHYHMTRRRGRTTLDIEAALQERLSSTAKVCDEPNMDNDYLAIGQYGRQLQWYEDFLTRGNLLVLFLDEMKSDEQTQLNRLIAFLGLADESLPTSFPHTHKGGTNRFGWFDDFLRNSNVVRFVARRLMNPEKRKALRFAYETRLSVRQTRNLEGITPELERMLRDYYREDRQRLKQLLGVEIPWP